MPTETKNKTFSAVDLRRLVRDGRKLIVFQDLVLDISAWMPYHPGGSEALEHAIGRDATDEILSLHPKEVLNGRVQKFAIGTYTSKALSCTSIRPAGKADPGQASVMASSTPFSDSPDIPTALRLRGDLDQSWAEDQPIGEATLARHQQLSRDYRAFHAEIVASGLLEEAYVGYTADLIRIPLLFTTAIALLLLAPTSLVAQTVSAAAIGMAWQQGSFVAHDLGHNAISLHRRTDAIIGIIIANVMGGVSLGWWKHNHNVHHIITNHPYDDPDIQHMPFFVVSPSLLGGFYSTYYRIHFAWGPLTSFLISLQHYLYYPILALGRFNLYVRSWIHLLTVSTDPLRYVEIAALALFLLWFPSLLLLSLPSPFAALRYLLLSHAVAGIVHVQITMSHFGMSTALLGPHESYPAKILRTTMDFDCPPYLDWFHGGLQYQVAHHFFPRAPRHHLRALTQRVRAWAEEHDLSYTHFSWVEGNGFVLGRMRDIANQVRFVVQIGKEQYGYRPPHTPSDETPHEALLRMGLKSN